MTSPSLQAALAQDRGSMRAVHALGVNLNIPDATDKLISFSSAAPAFPSTAGAATVVSSSAFDSAAGVGVQALRIEGLDANWNEQTVIVVMNGTTNVVTSESWIRINKVQAETTGSGNAASGNITVTVDSVTTATVFVTQTTAALALYSVPAGHKFALANYEATGKTLVDDTITVAVVKVWAQEFERAPIIKDYKTLTLTSNTGGAPRTIVNNTTDGVGAGGFGAAPNTPARANYDPYLLFPEKTDVYFTGASGATLGILMSLRFSGYLSGS